MWTEKYRPKLLEELVGNEEARLSLLEWLRTWKPGGKPILLLGPSGTGKSTAVQTVARELEYTVVELNASDSRTKAMLESIVGAASGGITVFGNRILLFLDEVDGIYSREDYGGLEFIVQILKNPSIPIAMAANMEYDERVEKLARYCRTAIFRPIPPRLVEIFLKNVLGKERVNVKQEVLHKVLISCRGDMRAALNTLQAAMASSETASTYRDRQLELPVCVNRVLGAQDEGEATGYLNDCSASPEEKLRAFHSSLLSGVTPLDGLAEALRSLSDADLLYAKMMRTQSWRLLRYFNSVVASGLVKARVGKTATYNEYWLPWRISNKAWNVGMPIRGLASVLARYMHVSQRKFLLYFMPYLPMMLEDVKALATVPGVDESMLKAVKSYSERPKGDLVRGD